MILEDILSEMDRENGSKVIFGSAADAALQIAAHLKKKNRYHPDDGWKLAAQMFCDGPSPNSRECFAAAFKAAPGETLFVGDRDTDAEAAIAAGVAFCYASEFFGGE